MSPRIAVLGGGSVFVAGVFRSLFAWADRVENIELVLQDINLPRALTMVELGRNLARAAGMDLRIEGTGDLEHALDGADYVLTCFRVGGFDALKFDEDIPVKHGLFGNETEGVGGIFMALRTVPVVVDIAQLLDPTVMCVQKAKACMAEMLEAQKQWLPQFA